MEPQLLLAYEELNYEISYEIMEWLAKDVKNRFCLKTFVSQNIDNGNIGIIVETCYEDQKDLVESFCFGWMTLRKQESCIED